MPSVDCDILLEDTPDMQCPKEAEWKFKHKLYAEFVMAEFLNSNCVWREIDYQGEWRTRILKWNIIKSRNSFKKYKMYRQKESLQFPRRFAAVYGALLSDHDAIGQTTSIETPTRPDNNGILEFAIDLLRKK